MIEVGHRDHRVEPVERVARRVGVDRRQAAVVAGVHGLQHVQRLFAADFADDDAVGPHAQGVAHQVAAGVTAPLPSMFAGRVSSRTTCRWRSCSSAASSMVTMRSLSRDEARQDVEQRRLAGAGAAGDDDVEPAGDRGLEEVEHRLASATRASTRSSAPSRSVRNRRIDSTGPSSASGGMIALTREPSASRASTIGLDSSMRRPTRADDALDDLHAGGGRRWKGTSVGSSLPFRST